MRALPAQKITRRVMLTFFVYVREKLTVVMTKTSPDYLVYAPVSLRQERKCCGHVRLPASHWWCPLSVGVSTDKRVVRNLRKTGLILVGPGLKIKAHTIVTSCWLSSYCLSYARSLESSYLQCSCTPSTRDNQPSAFGNTRFHFTRPVKLKQSRYEPGWLQNFWRNAAIVRP